MAQNRLTANDVLDMQSKRIENVANPTSAQDAATMDYAQADVGLLTTSGNPAGQETITSPNVDFIIGAVGESSANLTIRGGAQIEALDGPVVKSDSNGNLSSGTIVTGDIGANQINISQFDVATRDVINGAIQTPTTPSADSAITISDAGDIGTISLATLGGGGATTLAGLGDVPTPPMGRHVLQSQDFSSDGSGLSYAWTDRQPVVWQIDGTSSSSIGTSTDPVLAFDLLHRESDDSFWLIEDDPTGGTIRHNISDADLLLIAARLGTSVDDIAGFKNLKGAGVTLTGPITAAVWNLRETGFNTDGNAQSITFQIPGTDIDPTVGVEIYIEDSSDSSVNVTGTVTSFTDSAIIISVTEINGTAAANITAVDFDIRIGSGSGEDSPLSVQEGGAEVKADVTTIDVTGVGAEARIHTDGDATGLVEINVPGLDVIGGTALDDDAHGTATNVANIDFVSNSGVIVSKTGSGTGSTAVVTINTVPTPQVADDGTFLIGSNDGSEGSYDWATAAQFATAVDTAIGVTSSGASDLFLNAAGNFVSPGDSSLDAFGVTRYEFATGDLVEFEELIGGVATDFQGRISSIVDVAASDITAEFNSVGAYTGHFIVNFATNEIASDYRDATEQRYPVKADTTENRIVAALASQIVPPDRFSDPAGGVANEITEGAISTTGTLVRFKGYNSDSDTGFETVEINSDDVPGTGLPEFALAQVGIFDNVRLSGSVVAVNTLPDTVIPGQTIILNTGSSPNLPGVYTGVGEDWTPRFVSPFLSAIIGGTVNVLSGEIVFVQGTYYRNVGLAGLDVTIDDADFVTTDLTTDDWETVLTGNPDVSGIREQLDHLGEELNDLLSQSGAVVDELFQFYGFNNTIGTAAADFVHTTVSSNANIPNNLNLRLEDWGLTAALNDAFSAYQSHSATDSTNWVNAPGGRRSVVVHFINPNGTNPSGRGVTTGARATFVRDKEVAGEWTVVNGTLPWSVPLDGTGDEEISLQFRFFRAIEPLVGDNDALYVGINPDDMVQDDGGTAIAEDMTGDYSVVFTFPNGAEATEVDYYDITGGGSASFSVEAGGRITRGEDFFGPYLRMETNYTPHSVSGFATNLVSLPNTTIFVYHSTVSTSAFNSVLTALVSNRDVLTVDGIEYQPIDESWISDEIVRDNQIFSDVHPDGEEHYIFDSTLNTFIVGDEDLGIDGHLYDAPVGNEGLGVYLTGDTLTLFFNAAAADAQAAGLAIGAHLAVGTDATTEPQSTLIVTGSIQNSPTAFLVQFNILSGRDAIEGGIINGFATGAAFERWYILDTDVFVGSEGDIMTFNGYNTDGRPELTNTPLPPTLIKPVWDGAQFVRMGTDDGIDYIEKEFITGDNVDSQTLYGFIRETPNRLEVYTNNNDPIVADTIRSGGTLVLSQNFTAST